MIAKREKFEEFLECDHCKGEVDNNPHVELFICEECGIWEGDYTLKFICKECGELCDKEECTCGNKEEEI
jgi:hypothetical protein